MPPTVGLRVVSSPSTVSHLTLSGAPNDDDDNDGENKIRITHVLLQYVYFPFLYTLLPSRLLS